jgi:hypothetical protein
VCVALNRPVLHGVCDAQLALRLLDVCPVVLLVVQWRSRGGHKETELVDRQEVTARTAEKEMSDRQNNSQHPNTDPSSTVA